MKVTKATCVDCGQEFEYEGYRKKERCVQCAFGRVANIAHQIHAKEGPEYEKWAKRMVEVGIPRMIAGLERYREELAKAVAEN